MSSQSISLYNLLAKKRLFKKTINFDLKRIIQALEKLENPERKLKNVIFYLEVKEEELKLPEQLH